jgi:thiol-disulfide isomerase/thioredoxin
MRIWLAVLVGCAAAPPVPPVAPPDPNGLVREMAARYHTLVTYADRGKVTIEVTSAGKTQTESHVFATSYVRNDRLHFAFDQIGSLDDSFDLWSNGVHTYAKAHSLDHIVDFEKQPALALTALAEASHGVTRRAVWNLEHVAIVPDALVVAAGDARTWHLTGKDDELFIDRRTMLLSRVVEHHHFAPTPSRPVAADLTVTIDYEPRPNGKIGEAALRPPELTLPIESMFPPAWLGILPDGTTSRVAEVVPGGPAEKAGLRSGDEITSIDGHPISTSKEVVATSHAMKPQQTAMIVVKRGATNVPIAVVAEARPSADQLQAGLVGHPAPAFSLPALAGGPPIELAAGSATVLDFWATWCGPCAILSPHLAEMAKRFPSLRVIGISDEDPSDVGAYLVRHAMTYPIAIDAGDKATRSYLVQGLPSVFVIDKAGVVRYAAVGVPDFTELDAAVAKAIR